MNSESNKELTNDLDKASEEAKAPMYQVVLHNDEFTPKDFVVDILEKFFFMYKKCASNVMLEAHLQGKAGCGIFVKDYAESKISQVVDYARSYEHPLICSMEVALS